MPSTGIDANGPGRRTGRVVDRASTVLLLVVLAVVAAGLFFFGALIGMKADVCGGEATCVDPVIDVATFTTMYAPTPLLLLAVVVTVRRWRRDRLTVPVPLIGLALVVGVVLACDVVIDLAITRR